MFQVALGILKVQYNDIIAMLQGYCAEIIDFVLFLYMVVFIKYV